MDIIGQKQAIRKSILLRREALSASERTAFNAAISETLLQLPDYRQAETVLGYMNFGSEFAGAEWAVRVLAEGHRLVLPKVNRHSNMLDLYVVDDLKSQLAAGSWGIREPVVERCKRLKDINEVEFALLPGIAFSRNGARLGYGGGFYDKLLMHVTPQTALVAGVYGLQLVEHIPQEPTDVKVAWIVTETDTINCMESKHL